MDDLIADGSLINIALGLVVLEVVVLLVLAWRGRIAMQPVDVLGQLLAGGILLLAVRLAMADVDPRIVLGLIAASLPPHAFDLARRLRARGD